MRESFTIHYTLKFLFLFFALSSSIKKQRNFFFKFKFFKVSFFFPFQRQPHINRFVDGCCCRRHLLVLGQGFNPQFRGSPLKEAVEVRKCDQRYPTTVPFLAVVVVDTAEVGSLIVHNSFNFLLWTRMERVSSLK